MLQRYSTKEFQELWSEQKKYESWLLVEIYAAEAYRKHNKNITKADIDNLWKKAKVDAKRIDEIEQETKHDIIAFTRQVSETLGPEKKWVHYGLTSTDVVDTAQSYRLKLANEILRKDLKEITKTIKAMAKKHKYTYQMGRTHGIHAEVTTFGYKLAMWFDEMNRNIDRFDRAAKQIEVAKISGAVGNYANIPLDVQDYIAKKMGLTSSKISTQTLQRDRHAEYVFSLSLIASSLDKFATEIRHLQRTEVREVEEGFSKGQKGSSAMPHKRNPISSENISGCARVLRGYLTTAMENLALWHERDISHSSAERFILADGTATLDYMLRRFNNVLKNLVVNKEKMKENIFLTNGVIFSQRTMLKAIEKFKWSREKAYDTVQPIAMDCFHNGYDFGGKLIENKVLTEAEVKELYDLSYYTENVDAVFKRLGL